MFTGLVTGMGTVHALEPTADGARLVLTGPLPAQCAPGDSIAVDGVCVSLTALEDPGGSDPAESRRFSVDLMAPTLQRTTLGQCSGGDRVNLEPALLAGDRLGGHIVTGHIDGVGEVLSREVGASADMLRLRVPARLGRYLVPQGSIALDGVSLTVAELEDEGERTIVTIGLIPITRRETTVGLRAQGEHVNVEVDLLAKHVERLLHHEETAHA